MGNVRKTIAALMLPLMVWAATSIIEDKGMSLPIEVSYAILVICPLIILMMYRAEVIGLWNRLIISNPKARFVKRDTATNQISIYIPKWMLWATIIPAVLVLLNYCPAVIKEAELNAQWLHPSLSEAEIQKAENECLMRAYEAIPPSGNPYALGSTDADRDSYSQACMERQGFTWQKVEP